MATYEPDKVDALEGHCMSFTDDKVDALERHWFSLRTDDALERHWFFRAKPWRRQLHLSPLDAVAIPFGCAQSVHTFTCEDAQEAT